MAEQIADHLDLQLPQVLISDDASHLQLLNILKCYDGASNADGHVGESGVC